MQKLIEYSQAANIAELLSEGDLDSIGDKIVKNYERDESSREEWLDKTEKAMELAKQITEKKSFPWSGASNVKYPIISIAAIQFNARALPAIVQDQVVKGKIIGRDETAEKQSRAERVGKHMSYQYLEKMEEWEEDTDRLLISLPIVGSIFRKTYYDPLKGRCASKLVHACDFTYNYNTTFDRAPRHTEKIELFPYEIRSRQRLGLYVESELFDEMEEDKEEAQLIIEQHCLLDLDDDGLKEPYVATVHKEKKKVLRIVARYDLSDISIKQGEEARKLGDIIEEHQQAQQQQAMVLQEYQAQASQVYEAGFIPPPPPELPPIPQPDLEGATVVSIDAIKYYTKYGFIPDPEGKGYDIGLGYLLADLSESINTSLNQMFDAGTLQNLGGGWISKGLRVRRGEIQRRIGEWKSIENTSGMSLRENIVPDQNQGPSVVLFQLLGFLVDASKNLSTVNDAMVGEAGGMNEPATTFITRINEGMKVFNAIYKRIYRSLKQEFKVLYRLNGIYLDQEEYFTVLDDEQAIKQQDYLTDGVDVVPVADPTVATDVQKMAKVQALMQMGTNDPDYDQYEIKRRGLEALEIPDIDKVLIPPEKKQQPPPPPEYFKIMAESEKTRAETEKTRAEMVEVYAKVLKLFADAEKAEVGTQLDVYKQELEELKLRIEDDNRVRAQGMEAAGNNQGNFPVAL